MKKIALSLALVLGLALATASTASAKDMSNRMGIGADSTFGWTAGGATATTGNPDMTSALPTQGLSIVYNVSKMFGIQLILGAGFGSASDDANDYSANGFGLAVRGIIPIAFTNDVNLGAVVGFSFLSASYSTTVQASNTTTDLSGSWLAFDLGIRPEWFITEHFSIHTQIGVSLSLIGENDFGPFLPDSGGSGVAFSIFNNPDFLGQAGWTFYF